jgi:hypothetical protein
MPSRPQPALSLIWKGILHWGSGAVCCSGGRPAEAPPSQSMNPSISLSTPSWHAGFSSG